MPQLSDAVRTTLSEDGGIVLDIRRGQMLRVNPTGALILELLQAGKSESQIANEIERRYGIGEATARSDVREFLELLEHQQLLAAPGAAKCP